jgi:hypothetical protein
MPVDSRRMNAWMRALSRACSLASCRLVLEAPRLATESKSKVQGREKSYGKK